MDGGQTKIIPLDSDLDIAAHDMLVPVDAPEFLHNRQKFTGRCLPSSVRFEHDGWAAGHHVYNFTLNRHSIPTTPEGYTIDYYSLGGNASVYQLNIAEHDGNVVGSIRIIKDSVPIGDSLVVADSDTNSDVLITGDIDGLKVHLIFHSIDRTLTAGSSHAPELTFEYSVMDNGRVDVSLTNTVNTVTLDINGMVLGKDGIIGSDNLPYIGYTDGVHTWRSDTVIIEYDDSINDVTMSLASGGTNVLLLSDRPKITGNKVTADIQVEFSGSITYNTTIQTYIYYFLLTGNKFTHTQGIMDNNNTLAKWILSNNGYDNGKRYNGSRYLCNTEAGLVNSQLLEMQVPVWMQAYLYDVVNHGDELLDDVPVPDFAISGSAVASGESSNPNGAWERYSYSMSLDTYFIHDGKDAQNNMLMYAPGYMADVDFIWNMESNRASVDSEMCVTSDISFLPKFTIESKHGDDREKFVVRVRLPDKYDITGQELVYGREVDVYYTDDTDGVVPFDIANTLSVAYGHGYISTGSYKKFAIGIHSINIKSLKYTYTSGSGSYTVIYEPNDIELIGIANYCELVIDVRLDWFDPLSPKEGDTFKARLGPKSLMDGTEILYKYLTYKYTDSDGNEQSELRWQIAEVTNKPNYVTMMKSHLDYSDDAIGEKIEPHVLSACRNGTLSRLVSITEPMSALTQISAGFVRSGLTIADGPTFNDTWYIDRGSYHWFDMAVDVTQTATGIQFTTKLAPAEHNQLYWYDGFEGTEVPAIDQSGKDRYSVKASLCGEVGYCSVDMIPNDGSDIGAVRRLESKVAVDPIGVTDLDVYVNKALTVKTRVGQYTGEFVFTDPDTRLNAKVNVSQDIQFVLSDGTTVVGHNDGNVYEYKWLPKLPVKHDMGDIVILPVVSTSGVITGEADFKTDIAFSSELPACTDIEYTLLSADMTTGVAIVSKADEAISLTYSNGSATLNANGTAYNIPDNAIAIAGDIISVSYTYVPSYARQFYAKQVIKSDVDVELITPTLLEFNSDGTKYTIDMSESQTGLFNRNSASSMTFNAVDVYDPDIKSIDLATMDTNGQFQFVRQAWDTDATTECFWCVSQNVHLILTPTTIIRMVRQDTLHDWHGDNWSEDKTWPRASIIPNSAVKYLCSSAFGTTPVVLSVTISGASQLAVDIWDPVTEQMQSITISVVTVSLGAKLNGAFTGTKNITLYSYDIINILDLVSASTWTATCRDNNIIIGIHYNNNFNQWAIVVDRQSMSIYSIQGYGYVGVNGSLTGGEIPSICFNAAAGGFAETVYPLSILDENQDKYGTTITDISNTRNIVVGDSTQQWYLYAKVDGIVSHLVYNNGGFVAEILPISNMYAANYASGSCAGYNYEPWSIVRRSAGELGSDSTWANALGALGNPGIYFSAPITVGVCYLQQSAVQAAYVHYNSTSIHKSIDLTAKSSDNATYNPLQERNIDKDLSPLSSDSIAFDKVKIVQKKAVPMSQPNGANGLQLFMGLLTGAVDSFISDGLKINEVTNMTSTEATAKQYGMLFSANIGSAIVSSIRSRTLNPTKLSQVVLLKSLDMFYSTSDTQKIQAGPGFVNHAFVAQCTAQSVTSIQYDSYARSITCVYPGLTRLEAIPVYMITNGLYIAAKAALEGQLAPSMQGAMSVIVSPGYFVAIAASVTLAAAETAFATIKTQLDGIMEAVSVLGRQGPKQNILDTHGKDAYDIEASHKYGSKSEQFMWPCFGIDTLSIPDETVECVMEHTDIQMPYDYPKVSLGPGATSSGIDAVTNPVSISLSDKSQCTLRYYTGMVTGHSADRQLPANMAYAIGTSTFLSKTPFRNENISESEPVFPSPIIHDYMLDKEWQLGVTSPGYGSISWVSCKDTKIIDGPPSNIVISESFCGVASSYAYVEVKRGIDSRYVRPWAVTPQALLFNNTGLNCCYGNEVFHACDGQSYRLTGWLGGAGMNKENMTLLYSYIQNQRLKLSNKLPPNQLLGNYNTEPTVALETATASDSVYVLLTQPQRQRGLSAGDIGEDKDLIRYSIPIFTEQVALLPAAVKTYSGYTLSVVEGITGLVTDLRTDMSGYKVPISEDFTIGNTLYRLTEEYICRVTNSNGVSVMESLVPVLGLRFLGATPHEAYFYSQATRLYYVYTGGDRLNAVDSTERFRDLVHGLYDFVGQEVVVPALATFNRLDKHVHDDADETDNVIVPRLKQQRFIGEVWPPLNTIYNTRSWYRLMSLPVGITYQGPNRCIITQFLVSDYMVPSILANKGKWKRVPREKYNPFRVYHAVYETVDKQIGEDVLISGWTHNPFLLVTAPLGLSQDNDCLFEWVITFCWTVEMDKLVAQNEYICVNIMSETMSPGGKKVAERPTHVFLSKELFTRSDNYGYYSFRYSGQTGAGNRERLHIWSDGFMAVSSLSIEYKPITMRRNEILTQQVDVIGRLVEM